MRAKRWLKKCSIYVEVRESLDLSLSSPQHILILLLYTIPYSQASHGVFQVIVQNVVYK